MVESNQWTNERAEYYLWTDDINSILIADFTNYTYNTSKLKYMKDTNVKLFKNDPKQFQFPNVFQCGTCMNLLFLGRINVLVKYIILPIILAKIASLNHLFGLWIQIWRYWAVLDALTFPLVVSLNSSATMTERLSPFAYLWQCFNSTLHLHPLSSD